MDKSVSVNEGFIPFRGYNIWYRIIGDGEAPGKLPLLCLHGGPGAAWDYLEPLEALAATGRRVVFYDQLGCGNSGVPTDRSIYTTALYVEEIGVVRRALGLEQVHLLGHSWGGMLALEYALTQPAGLAGLILSNTGASMPLWEAEMRRLVSELPPDVQQTIQEHEAAGTIDSPEYRAADREYSRRYLGGRIHLTPECLTRTAGKPGDDVYHYMWGPTEFFVTGTLKEWDVTNRLGEIRLPTLVIGGRYDEATPAVMESIHRGIAGSEWVTLENSGHLAHLEETDLYLQALGRFLERVEAQA